MSRQLSYHGSCHIMVWWISVGSVPIFKLGYLDNLSRCTLKGLNIFLVCTSCLLYITQESGDGDVAGDNVEEPGPSFIDNSGSQSSPGNNAASTSVPVDTINIDTSVTSNDTTTDHNVISTTNEPDVNED